MRARLAYGRNGLEVDLPVGVTLIEPSHRPGLTDERSAVIDALRSPIAGPALASLARPGQRAVVVFSDITRPVPNRRILPPLLAELDAAGVRREDITLLNATGLHRPNTRDELVEMLGEEIVESYRVVNHVASDAASLELVGRTSRGTAVLLDREYLRADLRILTGFVEPHLFAGFSGGAKSLLPGVSGEATVQSNHGAAILADRRATWGVTEGNPVFAEAREVAQLAPPSFILNVTMNREREITGVFAGELLAAHDAACAFARESAMQPVAEPFDVVVTTNSGYPLDMNLYQAVKGMSAAAQVTKPGGAIVLAAECAEGVGHGHFVDLLTSRESPRELLDDIFSPGFQVIDQWQVQILAELLLRHSIYLYSDRLNVADVRRAHLRPSADVAATVAELRAAIGPAARVAVMPEGPLTIPYLC